MTPCSFAIDLWGPVTRVAPVNACMELEPKNANCKMLQANVLKRTGKTREADAAYQEALKLKEAEKQAGAEKPRKGGKRP